MSEINNHLYNQPCAISEIKSGYVQERAELRMPWDEYICYLLEVDREQVNEDELHQLAGVLLSELEVHP